MQIQKLLNINKVNILNVPPEWTQYSLNSLNIKGVKWSFQQKKQGSAIQDCGPNSSYLTHCSSVPGFQTLPVRTGRRVEGWIWGCYITWCYSPNGGATCQSRQVLSSPFVPSSYLSISTIWSFLGFCDDPKPRTMPSYFPFRRCRCGPAKPHVSS